MAAYGRVDDGHLRADCLYTGISSGPNARYRVWESLYLLPLRKWGDKTLCCDKMKGTEKITHRPIRDAPELTFWTLSTS